MSETKQAVIKNGNVITIIIADDSFVPDVDHDSMVNITNVTPEPCIDWTYDGTFHAPKFNFAKIVNDAVDSILNIDVYEANALRDAGDTLIDITNEDPNIAVGWSYVAGEFSAP